MPKPAKKHKPDQSRETAADPNDSSEAKLASSMLLTLKACHLNFHMKRCLNTLLLSLPMKACGHKTMLQQVFTSSESRLKENVDSMVKRIDETAASTDSLAARLSPPWNTTLLR